LRSFWRRFALTTVIKSTLGSRVRDRKRVSPSGICFAFGNDSLGARLVTRNFILAISESLDRPSAALSPLRTYNLDACEPIRGDLFGLDRLEARARELAQSIEVTRAANKLLLRRFEDNRRTLIDTHAVLSEAYAQRERLGPDAEWLLDNFHIISEAFAEIRVDLPRGYYNLLPKVAKGALRGYPRVYVLALELIAHTDSVVDENHLFHFLEAFQAVAPLTIGELWAVPIMLRLLLVENLRRLAEQIVRARRERRGAKDWAKRCLPVALGHDAARTTGERNPGATALGGQQQAPPGARGGPVTGQTAASLPPSCSDAFVVCLLELLHDQELEMSFGPEWVDQLLRNQNLTIADILRREQQRQAANQVSIGNCVTSLRVISVLDWMAFFERTSLVERVLRQDPAGIYARQDGATRDRYRRVIEKLARRSHLAEPAAATEAIRLSRQAVVGGQGSRVRSQESGVRGQGAEGGDQRAEVNGQEDRSAASTWAGSGTSLPLRRHVGYFLVGDGLRELETALAYRLTWRDRLFRFIYDFPAGVYFGSVAVATAFLLSALAFFLARMDGGGGLAVAILASLLPATELAIGLVHHAVTSFLPPRAYARMDFQKGVPDDCATFVVIPCLLTGPKSASHLVERLEIHYLSNPVPQLQFALLTDFVDAPTERVPEDGATLAAAQAGINALNERHFPNGPRRFFLFHRRRVWNPGENCWMGWERKRGKLLEFNRLLRGARDTTFVTASGALEATPPIRFVITLDADTQLPRDAAQRLIATLAHPLNEPRLDPVKGWVSHGYGILQPRIGIALRAANKSWFARIYAGTAGLDPYVTAVSDVYQDLFGSGSFTGKGIYDVDVFRAMTEETFPENRILSHDLIEGNYARCGLVTDVELLDDFPATYPAFARREHRWVRGDWQILPWLFPRVPAAGGAARRNPLPVLERWKILDNLRRSLLPPSLIILLALGWMVLPGPAWLWSTAALVVLSFPLLLQLGGIPVRLWQSLWRRPAPPLVPDSLASTAGRVLLAIVFLADQARHALDAIIRTLVRKYVTHRHLLEWETAAVTERRHGSGLRDMLRFVGPSSALALVLAACVAWVRPEAIWAACPFLVAWIVAPLVAYLSGRDRAIEEAVLTEAERRYLTRLARLTWSFFEAYVSAEDNWLPPDNYQENPKGEVAHRTSPTNIGLYLLSCLAAHDFGYLSLVALLQRLEKTFEVLGRLERSHGHFINWYDTKTLRPLEPRYLSTVDSGNMLGCLVALKNGLYEKARDKAPGSAALTGLADTFALVEEAFRGLEPAGAAAHRSVFGAVEQRLAGLKRLLENPELLWAARLKELQGDGQRLSEEVRKLAELIEESPDDLSRWTGLFLGQINDRLEELAAQDTEAASWSARSERLAEQAATFAGAMDFKMFYSEVRHLFAVGYNLAHERLDGAHYDLLASEAALTSFLAVARGEVPKKHWFRLGRPCTKIGGRVALLSWGGTMFEYLMPRLLLPCLPDTLLDESQRAAAWAQRDYGRQRRVPWGISESAFSALDAELNYQYQAFGVPRLGLKRGLANDLVIAPYAAALAVMVSPHEAVKNLQRLAAEGGEGPFGFYEAIDYTPERLPRGRRRVIVQCFMAHHQGMSFLSFANCLQNNRMVERFQAEPMVRATELLLQERIPQEIPLLALSSQDTSAATALPANLTLVSRRLTTPHTAQPRVHLLASGQYSVMVTNAGGSRSTCQALDVTRWREDRTLDPWGQFVYVRDLTTGLVWSAGYQPLDVEPEDFEVVYSVDKADFRRTDRGVETHLEITVAPDSHAEIRRLTFRNHGGESRTLEVTTYAEIVLGPHNADLAHPAFGKLFRQTEFVPALATLLCQRRPRSPEQKPIWCVQVAAMEGGVLDNLQFETDRAAFLGRGRDPSAPAAMDPGTRLGGHTGAVLDPIFSLRCRLRVAPGSSLSIAFTTALAEDRAQALVLADRFHDYHGVVRGFELAWAHCQVELRHLHITAQEAHQYQRLAGHIIYAGPALRAAPPILRANRQGQTALWRHGISGDQPIVLARIGQVEHLPLVRELLAAHAYLRLKGLTFDLVVLNEHEAGYLEDLQQQLQSLVRGSSERGLVDQPGGIFLRKASHMAPEDQILLQTAARCVFIAQRGNLVSHLDRAERVPTPVSTNGLARVKKVAKETKRPADRRPFLAEAGSLAFYNGAGGFTPDGREYVIHVGAGKNLPPAPWVNVVANPRFGFMASESGLGCTWAVNSQSNRLTPWSNDPVSDPPSEIVYVRDEEAGAFWSATPRPSGTSVAWRIRHGQGYTIFEHERNGLHHELLVMVSPRDPVKMLVLKVRNLDKKTRKLSATFFADWVLGGARDQAPMNVTLDVDRETEALVARNPFNTDFPNAVAFADVNQRPRLVSADRTEFLGRNGSRAAPRMMSQEGWAASVGAGLDPCIAIRHPFTLPGGGEKEVVFLLGQGADIEENRRLLRAYGQPGRAAATKKEVQDHWDRVLGVVQVRTPNPALDLLLNRWLLYQVLSARLWGRTGFYQSSGAYGFRDQLQDVLALLHSGPGLAREHILRAAAHQFVEGDVQHWWNVPRNDGIRTKFSDDFLWLPFVVERYIAATGDQSILEEEVPFLVAPLLKPDQDEDYRVPGVSEDKASLYEHCVRAVDHGLRFGEHGLPLMGTGDWNDGMNRVGNKGRGESVWTGWFVLKILLHFAGISEERGDRERAARYRDQAERLRQAIETAAWDGGWYRRAYFDDGTPLGSAQNDECKIDSLPQSWAVLSGAGDPERLPVAMAAVEKWLVKDDERLVLLFTPPFEKGPLQPGYIKGYVPGIRENGGQYTHAALWVVQATALLGQGTRAMELVDLLNPIHHAATPPLVDRYRVEPYVVAGDIYGAPPHVGRGGWTWYTGSAGWFYQVALETLLGFQRRGNTVVVNPCIPAQWARCEIAYRHGTALYHFVVENPGRLERGRQQVEVDGATQEHAAVELKDDGKVHEVRVLLS
jgi:cyclic beta-1,2-glucan synthetase